MLVLEGVLTLQPGYKYPPDTTSQHEERLWSQYLKCTATAATGILFCLIHYSSPTAAVKSYLGLSHLLPPLKTGSNIKILGHIFGVADPTHVRRMIDRWLWRLKTRSNLIRFGTYGCMVVM